MDWITISLSISKSIDVNGVLSTVADTNVELFIAVDVNVILSIATYSSMINGDYRFS